MPPSSDWVENTNSLDTTEPNTPSPQKEPAESDWDNLWTDLGGEG